MAGLALAGLPIGMILLQPDLGTALVYIVVTAVMIMMSHIVDAADRLARAVVGHRRSR